MRLRYLKTYYLKKKTLITDDEGGKYPGYEDTATIIKADIFPATGKLQAEIYGERLNYILNMLYAGAVDIAEGDGICVYVSSADKPDYKVISIKQYSHKFIELEKIL